MVGRRAYWPPDFDSLTHLDCGVMPLTSRRSSTDPWIMRHPLATYLVLVFAIAWLFWVPLACSTRAAPTFSRSVARHWSSCCKPLA